MLVTRRAESEDDYIGAEDNRIGADAIVLLRTSIRDATLLSV